MSPATGPVTEGTIPYIINGVEYHTWYKLFGQITQDSCPLITLHGGPGLTHHVMTAFADIANADPERPVIIYDQIGNGKSSHLRDAPDSLFNIDLFIREIDNLVTYLGIQRFHLCGHSWGGMLAAEFALTKYASALESIIITSAPAAMGLWMQSSGQLLMTLNDPSMLEGMKAGYARPQKYRAAIDKFHDAYGCLIRPKPEEMIITLDHVFGDRETGEGGDMTVSMKMNLKEWTIVDRLSKISVPTLVINGRKDIAQDFVCQDYFWKIPKARWVTLEKSSHMSFLEERERYMELVKGWIDSIA